MQDPSNEVRLGELLERRRLGALPEGERLELEALFEKEPGARALADQLDREEQAMNTTITAAVEHFDFEKAGRAIAAKLRADRNALLSQALVGLLAVAAAVVMAWLRGRGANWEAVIFVASAGALAVLGWSWALVRRSSAARSISGGGAMTPRDAYQRHLRDGRREFTILRALVIVGGLAFVILLVNAIMSGSYVKATLVTLGLVVLGPLVGRWLFTRAAAARHEKFLAGDLTSSAWVRGEDEPR